MKTENEGALELSKELPATVDELYNAWISPEALKEWWMPMGHKLTEVKNEVKEGGNIEYRAEDSENPLIISGKYKEVKEQEKLIYNWDFNFTKEALEESPYLLTIEFSSNGNGSRLKVKQENLKDDEAVKVHKQGWEKQLENLKNYLNNLSS